MLSQEISQLSPKEVWQFFEQVCSIPHPSKHEAALAKHIVDWAKGQGLDVSQDEVGNILIKKPAYKGMEHKKSVALQAHVDMVPQKNGDVDHDFIKDPIQPYVDGDWVRAKGTTLGADNGIGMSSCLAVLASTDIKHGPIEVLLTIDEEAGMTGAFALKPNWLESDILLNTDSEQEGEVYIGCAGGANASLIFDIVHAPIPSGFETVKLSVKGFKGGHSGCDIHTGRGNANKFFARFLAVYADELDLRIIDFTGGSLRNAIPREATVIAALSAANKAKLETSLKDFTNLVISELAAVEPDITSSVEMLANDLYQNSFDTDLQTRFIGAINASPNGVIRMDDNIEGVVETSLNMGVISTTDQSITVLSLIRSLVDSGNDMVQTMVESVAKLSGATFKVSDAYPGWKPDPESKIIHLFRDVYEGIYGKKPNIMVIHAGLECGLFKKPYPNMDMISFGPTIKFPHSPDEKVLISSVDLYWEQMIAILEQIPEK